jgi:predicted AAA+ superfamily ATPase
MFIQVIAGPRQVGKTTIAISLQKEYEGLIEYHSSDDAVGNTIAWVDQIWESLRIKMKLNKIDEAVLILDEIQKISDWSAIVKKHWDRDTREGTAIKPLLLGSSRLLLMDGLSESLMGRYELSYAGHWGFCEMRESFGFTLDEYLWFGGYPGAARLKHDESRFKEYIKNSIAEPTMTRDILLTTKIDKPALLRLLFEVGVECSAQIVSYNKLLGQLQDAGNTTTLAKYLRLLDQSGLLSGLNKYTGSKITTKGSIPKFQVQNPAIYAAYRRESFEEHYTNLAKWGYIVENAVGAYLVDNIKNNSKISLFYWRDGNVEIDYVILYDNKIIGLEVKSGDEGIPNKVVARFKQRYPDSKLLLVGKHGIPLEILFKTQLEDIINNI